MKDSYMRQTNNKSSLNFASKEKLLLLNNQSTI